LRYILKLRQVWSYIVGRGRSMALSDLRVGQSAILESLELPDKVSDHLAHLGFLPGANVEVLRRAPAGDPTVYRIDGVEVALRKETARHITVEVAESQYSAAGSRN
jgi:Fe2+ transport system protein FeoA